MPSSWKMPLNAGSQNLCHRKSSGMGVLPKPKLLDLRKPSAPKAQMLDKRRGSTRASSPLPRHDVIAICGRTPSDPHHLRYLQPRALGRKASDEFAVPLCRVHHRAVHRARDERAWWQAAGIDPSKISRKLWKETRIDGGRIEPEGTTRAAPGDRSPRPGGDVPERQGPA
jgi:hypothetical protein